MMSAPRPQLSVLMPVWNAELYVGDAIRSVLDQSFCDFELLVLDDGSDDRSPDIAMAFAEADDRVRVIAREHRGLVASLNELMDGASAPLIARMDADDVCLPKRFLRQTNFLKSQPRTVCVGGSVLFIDHRGETLGRGAALLSDGAIQDAAMRGRSPICHGAAMYRAEAARRVGGYRGRAHPASDLDLWLRLGELGELANLPDDVLAYRQHGSSLSFHTGDQLIRAAERVCKEAARRRKVPVRFEHDRRGAECVGRDGLSAGGAGGSVRASAG